ncbi:hypothetical protein BsWGS_28220 [Bradybaena similaris]
MSAVIWQAVLLLGGQMLLNWFVQGCDPGWFGRACNFPCRCNASNICGPNGECPPNQRCLIGYFGPGCQYVDLALNKTKGSEAYLYDNNDTTCNPDQQATSVYYSLDQLWPLSWFRIYTRSNPNLFGFTVVVNSFAPYKDERHFIVSEHEIDVTWDSQYEIRSLRIKGDIAPTVCSIYLTSGRNVALKQFANETNQQSGAKGGASNAVDGNINDKVDGGSCVYTKPEASTVWNLFFPRPQIIRLAYVYNSDRRDPLKGFNLRIIDTSGTTVFNYTDRQPYAHPDYYILVKPVRPAIRIELRPCLGSNGQYKSFIFCEIEVYGDNQCPQGKYGLDCEQTCSCAANRKCNQVTGACSPRCPPGKHGSYCLSDCSGYCLNQKCHEDTGACFGCLEGYKGDKCDVKCSPGTYGSECAYSCSVNCVDQCDFATGRCSECVSGFYGKNCTDRCPEGCKNRICQRDTGKCEECIPGRMGQYCTACPPGTYGAMCFLMCSDQCFNHTCDSQTGYCIHCMEGFKGPHCLSEHVVHATQGGDFIMWMIVMVITFLVVIPLVLIFCLQKDTAEQQPAINGEGQGGNPAPAGFDDETSLKNTGG